MASCVVCKGVCDDVNGIKCAGGCESMCHIKCVNSELDGKKVLRSNKEWKCKICRNTSSQGSLASSASSTSAVTKEFIIKVMEGFKSEFFNELKAYKSEMEDLSKSVQFISDKLDNTNGMMDEIKKKFVEIKNENQELLMQNSTLKSEVYELKERLRNLEQYSRKNNVEVSGIPATPGEHVSEVVKAVGAALGIEVQDGDVAAAHRVPTYKKDRQPSLVIQFQNRTMKEAWITKFREKKSLTAQQVNKNLPSARVYVNDHLTPENKQFLRRLKQKCRDCGYAFAWCRDGRFFARKAQGDAVKRIITCSDMDHLK